MLLLCKGLLLGFSIAAPVGPIGVLCIRRTLAFGAKCGFVSGLGAATADAIYGVTAALGVVAAASFFFEYQAGLQLIGGIYLLYLGWKTFCSPPVASDQVAALEQKKELWSSYASTFALTIINPMTIMSFAAVFAGLGMREGAAFSEAVPLVLGVFSGSLLWWAVLSAAVSFLRDKVDVKGMRQVNRLSGSIIILFGLYAVLHFSGF